MKNKWKISALLVSFALLLSACGESKEQASSTASGTSQAAAEASSTEETSSESTASSPTTSEDSVPEATDVLQKMNAYYEDGKAFHMLMESNFYGGTMLMDVTADSLGNSYVRVSEKAPPNASEESLDAIETYNIVESGHIVSYITVDSGENWMKMSQEVNNMSSTPSASETAASYAELAKKMSMSRENGAYIFSGTITRQDIKNNKSLFPQGGGEAVPAFQDLILDDIPFHLAVDEKDFHIREMSLQMTIAAGATSEESAAGADSTPQSMALSFILRDMVIDNSLTITLPEKAKNAKEFDMRDDALQQPSSGN